MSQVPSSIALRGGLNLSTPALEITPGELIGAVNYEPVDKGYHRVDGFERLDGRPKPSEATYWILQFTGGTAEIAEGDTVTGGTSGATGVALIDGVVVTGTYGAANAAGYLVLTGVTGTFQDAEDLDVSASPLATLDGEAEQAGADDDETDATYAEDAIETARALIVKPAGSGPIRGVWTYMGDTYCIRDNAGATAGVLYKATTAGWVAVDGGEYLDFTSGGTTVPVPGNVVTGHTSFNQMTVARVILKSGTWAAGTAAGTLIRDPAGVGTLDAFISETLEIGADTNVASVSGDLVTSALPAGGRYDFINRSFTDDPADELMFMVNGVGHAWAFDGTYLLPLKTGESTDSPSHIAEYKEHLFLSMGATVVNSGTGLPFSFNAADGAARFNAGTVVTGMLEDIAGYLAILCRNNVRTLTGSDSSDFDLLPLSKSAGAIEWTAQQITTPLYMDDQGVRDMKTTSALGGFKFGVVTAKVDAWLKDKKKQNIRPCGSIVSRAKGQYRLFMDDGTGLTIYLGRKEPDIVPFDLGFVVSTAFSCQDEDGDEILLAGSTDGWVYQLDAGTSFDGEEVEAYARLAFNHLASPSYNKDFCKVEIETDCPANASISVSCEYDYAGPNQPASPEISLNVEGGGAFWNEGNWNEFFWSAAVSGRAEAYPSGFGRNISVAILSQATYEEPHTLTGMTILYMMRGLAR